MDEIRKQIKKLKHLINDIKKQPKIVSITQAEYDALSSVNPNVLYVII